jgi:hypothetical protein
MSSRCTSHSSTRFPHRRIDSLTSPLVVVLPGGEGADVEAERRAQHLRILWEAVGYQIAFDRTDGST